MNENMFPKLESTDIFAGRIKELEAEIKRLQGIIVEGRKLFEESAKEIRRLREGIKNCYRIHDSPNWSSCSSCIYNLKERI